MDGPINDDVLFTIFSKLPLKTLLRCRSVSKLWLSIIDHPFLATLHLSRQSSLEPCILCLVNSDSANTNKKVKSFRVVEEKRRTLKPSHNPISQLQFSGSSMTLQGSCNGFLCFSDSKKQTFSLVNPFRNELFTLPLLDHELGYSYDYHLRGRTISGFGYDTSSKTYKVVRIVYKEFDSHVSRTTVYTLGASSWRKIPEVPPYPVHGNTVYAHGYLHWLVSPFVNVDINQEELVVCFDLREEKFSYTPHPRFDSKDSTLFGLLELKGKLGIVDLSGDTKIDIWVMRDYVKKQWLMEYRIEIHGASGRVNNGNIKVVGLWEDGEILLQADEGFFIYNKKTGLRYNQGLGLESDDSVMLRSHCWSLMSINSII